MDKLNSIKKSLIMNYKSWLLLITALVVISSTNGLGNGFATFGVLFIASHLLHYFAHFKNAYPQNIVHLYHHEHNNFFSHFIQIVVEFVALMSFMWMKYNIAAMSFLNEWVIIFFYLFYTTIHNINYSIYHVNRVHEMHHKLRIKNMGPDICDILFNTKYDVENSMENTDHYMPNIVICLILTMMLKSFWERRENKEPYETAMKYLFGGSVGLLILSTIYLIYEGKIKNEEHPEPDAAPVEAPAKEPEAAPVEEPEEEEESDPPSEIP